MSGGRDDDGPTAIRLVFQLDRAENPRLYDDLARFRKGVRRVNRLRLLAHEGLRVQQREGGWVAEGSGSGNQPAPESEGDITNGIFEPSIP
jgi:hypothetical protein